MLISCRLWQGRRLLAPLLQALGCGVRRKWRQASQRSHANQVARAEKAPFPEFACLPGRHEHAQGAADTWVLTGRRLPDFGVDPGDAGVRLYS